MRPALLLSLLGCACVLSCSPAAPRSNGSSVTTAQTPSAPSAALHALFDAEWDYALRDWPTRASMLGDRRFDDRWPDVSPAAFERRAAHDRDLLARLRAVDAKALPPDDRLSLELLTRETATSVEGEPFRLWHLAITQSDGVQLADDIADALPFATVRDYDAWIARLRALPAYLEQTTATLREGAREHIVQPRVVMERVPGQIDKQIVADPTQSSFFAPLRRIPASFAATDRERLAREAKEAIASAVVPAYRRFKDFFVGEYLPACFPEVGAWQMPRGKDAYAYLVRYHTTTNMTPQQVHDIGLREVARIRGEMLALMERVEFKGTLPDFFAWLRTDARFFYPDGPSLFRAYEATAKRIDPRLVKLFKTLPRTPYGVEAVPDNVAPDTYTAYYREPAADGTRAGTFFVNLYKPEARPKWEMMALALHESVPGHHLQIALASEQRGLPEFRRHGSYTAYVEGWGLYAESLGDEMGLYDDPYSKFGQLAYEMWRAVRLVVDTGMHSMHWDRQRAIDYFLANAPKTPLDVTNEIDRYISWPGQALAYKVGELEIKRLRRHASEALGPRFDVREFHDVVLRDGALPLDVLAERVDAWIAERKL
jgi:prolyl oligopeptidase